MKKLLKSIYVFILLTKAGFFFSSNLHKDKDNVWGFVRFNYQRGNINEYSIFDIDLQTGKGEYYHVHADKTLFRVDR